MIILCDTRENKNHVWDFGELESKSCKLESGDYTLKGYENIVCIERKKSPSELAINIGSDFTRFEKELVRMKSIPFSYIVCEFTLERLLEFPKNSDIPKSKLSQVKIGGKYLLKVLSSFKEKYNIDVLYCGDRDGAIDKTLEIFKYVTEITET